MEPPTPPHPSSSDSRMISPLSSDSGRGADYSGPAMTSYRSPTEVTGLLDMYKTKYWLLAAFAAKSEETNFGQYAVKDHLSILSISSDVNNNFFFSPVQKQLDHLFLHTDAVMVVLLSNINFIAY